MDPWQRKCPQGGAGQAAGAIIAALRGLRGAAGTLVLALAAASLAPSTALAQAVAEARLALVIGNSAYKKSPLPNAVSDARLMEAALLESGFVVIKAENAKLREMRRMVRDFGDRLQRSGGVGLFYYAGHGVQVRGENHLVSVDSDIRNEDEVADDSISAQLVLAKMESARNRVNIVILDACRDNPFASRTRSVGGGLAVMNAPSGSLVAYSTSPGAVAADGTGSNSLYTKHLATVMRQPGLPVEEVFKQVRAAVRRDSNNQQTPWENTALEGQFYFKPVAVAATPSLQAPALQATTPPAPGSEAFELAFWEAIKDSEKRADLDEYLKQFPAGRFAGLVRIRLADLDRAAASKPAPPTVQASPPVQAPPPLQARATVKPPPPVQAPQRSPERAAAAIEDKSPTQVAALRPRAPSEGVAGMFVSLGDGLRYQDADPVSGVVTGEFTRLVTKLTDNELELDRGALTISRAGPDIVRGNSAAMDILGAAPKQGGDAKAWAGQFHTGQAHYASVPLEFRFDRMETQRISGKELTLIRASVTGYASQRGVPGLRGSEGALIKGHVLIDKETGLLVEFQSTSDHPIYALRRRLAAVIEATR